ncbi:MAG: hypothetical protein COB65_01600 [Thalassobium sp.]|nr:MAG: hypothetical protein COB65_01600 [Thalassobium sp.]
MIMIAELIEYKIDLVLTENEKVKSCVIEGDIFYCYHKPDQITELEDIQMVFNGFLKHMKSSGKSHRLIVELAPHSSITTEARHFLEAHKEEALCEAIITYNMAQRILINFYFKFKSHRHPSKAFKDRESALAWANQF